jgi:hypothetical protein
VTSVLSQILCRFVKTRLISRCCALSVGLVGGLCSRPAWAETGHVENRCARLSQAEYEELDARVQLLLKGEVRSEAALPAIVCGPDGAYVDWNGRRHDIVGRLPIVDEVVDIIEGVLHDEERRRDADPRTTEEGAVAAGQPMLERGAGSAPTPPSSTRRADPVAVSPENARGGGISVGVEIDVPSKAIGPAIGPAFDFGASVGPLLIGGREAIRFTTSSAHRQLSFMDFQGSVAYGAPFNPDRRWGVVARFGAEWMIAYPEGNSSQATVVPIADLGLRAAHGIGSVSLWLGLDVHVRFEPLRLRSYDEVLTAQVSPSLTLGVAFVDWSRK